MDSKVEYALVTSGTFETNFTVFVTTVDGTAESKYI